uniref:Uncharacterized protein n=1 Tax=Arundo donax TaxID=35708 RepID=A0A0A8Y1W9_ARUDO
MSCHGCRGPLASPPNVGL